MSIWFAILLGVGIIAVLAAVTCRNSASGVYVGIVESGPVLDPDHSSLQVRAYVEEPLVHELSAASKLIGQMFIRETDTSVPLLFVRVPPYVSLKPERFDKWQEHVEVPVLPVIFRFDPPPDLAVHPGQVVDVCIGER